MAKKMEDLMMIYKITNLVNGKFYIGQTSASIKDRWSRHCNNGSHCTYLKNAIKKYGKDNFTIEEICVAKDRDELNKLEKSAIKEYDSLYPSGYNLTTGGDAFNHSEETKRKIGNANRGENNGMYGKTPFFKGKKHTAEMRKRISESCKLAWQKRKAS